VRIGPVRPEKPLTAYRPVQEVLAVRPGDAGFHGDRESDFPASGTRVQRPRGIEENYGTFVKARRYDDPKCPRCGLFVDLIV
jgi:hypothetical protein